MAVAAAAESVMALSADLVVTSPFTGKDSKERVPSCPLRYIPAALTCSNPIPSPIMKIMFRGIVLCEYAENETIKAVMKQKNFLTSNFSFQDEPISKVVRIQKSGFRIKPNLSSNSILSPVF
jgi:hypothetical protein